MGDKTLVTFNLDEERKSVWENEADDRGRSLSGFIRHCAETEIAGNRESTSEGTDHTEELSELHSLTQGVAYSVDALQEQVDILHNEVTIPEQTKEHIPEVVGVLPKEEQGGMTPEEIRERTSMTELSIIQCLNHTEEQTGIVGQRMNEEEGIREYYRRV